MHSENIDYRIKNYWAARERFVSDSERETFDRIEGMHDPGEYIPPSKETPVPAKRLVCWLDTSFMESLLREVFPRYGRIRERMGPRVRFLAYFCLSREICLKKAYRKLEPEDFYLMGFGEVPTYELLRDFINVRLGERRKEVFDTIISYLKKLLEKKGITLGKRVGEDATDVRALKHDNEAEYSGYYKEYGYKVDIVHDLDQETLPLDYTPLRINENEGKCLPESLEKLRGMGMHTVEWKVDGKYPTYENIALAETMGTHLVYRIHESWVFNPKGTADGIKRRYQTYHKREDFRPTKDISRMLSYLEKRGDQEHVGAYFRNLAMERYKKEPGEYLSECNERSGKTEGMVSAVKAETVLDTRLPRRGWKAFAYITDISMLSFVFAALIRVQNGDTKRLGNLTYIT